MASLYWNRDYLQAMLDHAFGSGASVAIPLTVDLSLWLGSPLGAGVEVSGGGYARNEDLTMVGLFDELSGGTAEGYPAVVLNTPIVFPPTGTASASWGNVTHMGVHVVTPSPGTGQELMCAFYAPDGYSVDGTLIDTLSLEAESAMGYMVSGVESGFSTLFLQNCLSRFLGGTDWSPPATVKFSLWRDDPFAGGGEVVGASYARLELDNDATTWSTGNVIVRNVPELRWPASGVSTEAWGEVKFVGVHDGTTGDLWFVAAASVGAGYVPAGGVFVLPAQALTLALDVLEM